MDILTGIKERRAIGNFDATREVGDDTLKELLATASLAPSSFNLQPWEVVVVRTSEMKQKLRACAFDQPKVQEASAVMIIIAKPSAVEEHFDAIMDDRERAGQMKPEMRKVYRDMAANLYGPVGSERRKVFAAKNAGLFAMTLMLTARGMGLECHPMDGFDEACVKQDFRIETDRVIPMLVAVGYPAQGHKQHPRAWRRSPDDFATFI